jgi:hypothetical protein
VPPFNNTDAAGTASLFSELLILPDTVEVWARIWVSDKKLRASMHNTFLLVIMVCSFDQELKKDETDLCYIHLNLSAEGFVINRFYLNLCKQKNI